ncbi:MAG TPA: RNA-binding protein [Chitinophaga sp.]|uniref:RNA-binding protein n=1 Tax=Chitinophaga sp. TaxID=1869181 RepID=UPI002C99ED9B|nr:RNA-binding protein [Chitinophaga sp.]HVI49035.1 RNA-binding protein [Chitinophaga sp.]
MKIYVGNLHGKASGKGLYDLFIAFGYVLFIEMRKDVSGRSSGYAYVYLKENNDGRSAIQQLNGINFMNQFLDIYEVH